MSTIHEGYATKKCTSLGLNTLINQEISHAFFYHFKTIEKYQKGMKIHQEICDNFWRFFRANLSMQRFKQQRNMVQIAKKTAKIENNRPNPKSESLEAQEALD